MIIDSYTQYKGDKKYIYGLFGTCGNSSWRTRFIKYFEKNNISYFNPNKKDWTPNDALIEADNLINNETLLFPVLDKEYGIASIFELLIAADNRNNTDNNIVVFIEQLSNFYNSTEKENNKIIKGINNAKKILEAHSKYNKNFSSKQIKLLESFEDSFIKNKENVIEYLKKLRSDIYIQLKEVSLENKNIIIVESLDEMFDIVESKNYN